MTERATLLYIGSGDEPEYVPGNFVSEDELRALLTKRIQTLGPSLVWCPKKESGNGHLSDNG